MDGCVPTTNGTAESPVLEAAMIALAADGTGTWVACGGGGLEGG